MTHFHRDITGVIEKDPSHIFQGYDAAICKRLEDAVQKGWNLEGSPKALWDPKENEIAVFQAISGHAEIAYTEFKPLGEIPLLANAGQAPRHVRFVAGEDTRPYCALIEGLLQDGWETHGDADFVYNERAQARWLVRLMTREATDSYPGFVNFVDIPSRQKDKTTRQALRDIGIAL